MRKILDHLAVTRPGTPEESVRRDRLLLAVGWAAALRPGELVALNVDDITFVGDADHGQGGMVVRIRRSRADRHVRIDHVAVPCANRSPACPVRLAQQAARHQLLGPLFAHVDLNGTPRGRLPANTVSRIVRAAVRDVLRRDPTTYASQSLRAGYITEARRRGVPDHLIARHTRHHNLRMLDSYEHPDDLFAQPAFGAWW